MPVTERGVLEAELRLAVALVEELLDAAGGPLVVQVPALGRVGHITGVEEEAQNLRLVETGKRKR